MRILGEFSGNARGAGIEFIVFHQHCAASCHHIGGVFCLFAVADGQRYENCGHTQGGHLRHGSGSGAANNQVRRRVGAIHLVEVIEHVIMRQSMSCGANGFVFAFAGQMEHLHSQTINVFSRFCQHLVDVLSSQRAASYQQRGKLGVEPELGCSHPPARRPV